MYTTFELLFTFVRGPVSMGGVCASPSHLRQLIHDMEAMRVRWVIWPMSEVLTRGTPPDTPSIYRGGPLDNLQTVWIGKPSFAQVGAGTWRSSTYVRDPAQKTRSQG